MFLTSVKTGVVVVALALVMSACALAGGLDLNLDMPAVFPEQRSIEIFNSKGPNTLGTYNTDTGDLFLSSPRGQIIEGHVDRHGNITIEQFGGDDD